VLKHIVGFALSLLLSLPASALLIEADLQAPGDALLTLDTETNLEWLDLTATLNLSFSQAGTSSYVTDLGFRHATTAEVALLFQEAGGAINTAFLASNTPAVQLLLDLLGCTNASSCGVLPSGALKGTSLGWALNTADPARPYLPNFGTNSSGSLGRLITPGRAGTPTERGGTIGNFLVRDAVHTPEPSVALLYALAIAIVALRLRRSPA